MPSEYSPLLRLELIGAGEQSGLWGNTTNKNVGTLLEQAIAGVTTVSLSGGAGDYTLTALEGTQDEARSAVLKFIGSPSGAKNIIIPTETKLYVVRNDCGQTIFIKTAAQVTGVTLLNGEASLVFCDGTNAVAGIATAGVGPTTVANGGTGATSFSGGFVKSPVGTGTLTSSATVNASTELSGTVPLERGGTGVSSFTAGAIVLGNGSSPLTVLTGSSAGQVATWNGTAWTPVTPASGGVTTVFGRSGAVTAQAGDYNAFYVGPSGSGASGVWNIGISGSAANADKLNNLNASEYLRVNQTAANSTQLGGVAAASYATLANTQTFTGAKTFSNTITSAAYNFTATTSIFSGGSQIEMAVGGLTKLTISSAGDLTITGSNATKVGGGDTWNVISDRRLKDNVVPYTKGLAELIQIQPKSFTYNGKGGTVNGEKSISIIADEIKQVLPDTVGVIELKLNPEDGQKSEIQTFNFSEIGWVMVNAIKELKAEVDSLKAQLAAK
jgi:hypothetical protein